MDNRLRVLRAEQKWSQAHLADLVAVSRQTINAIETGRHDPSLTVAFRLAAAFGLPIEDVFHPVRASTDASGNGEGRHDG